MEENEQRENRQTRHQNAPSVFSSKSNVAYLFKVGGHQPLLPVGVRRERAVRGCDLGRIVGLARRNRLAEQHVDGLEVVRPAALGALERLLRTQNQGGDEMVRKERKPPVERTVK